MNISNREVLQNLLLTLDNKTVPLWGKMTPQQMVEHLIDQVEYTNGKKTPTSDTSPEDAQKGKLSFIYGDAEIPRNLVLGTLPEHYSYPDLETAIYQLLKELKDFDAFFKAPDVMVIHGGFGPMNYNEWLIWHGKHFKHHFKQFGLIPL